MSLGNEYAEAKRKNAEAGRPVVCEACYREGTKLVTLPATELWKREMIMCEDPGPCVENFMGMR